VNKLIDHRRPKLAPRVVPRACFFILVSLPMPCLAGCKGAGKSDVPNGANELVEIAEQEVGAIRGIVLAPGSKEPFADVVVEVYRFTGQDTYQNLQETVAKKRLAGCITRKGGKFSFPDLEPGGYLLRLGTPYPHGINEAYAIVTLGPWVRSKRIEIQLTLGT